MAYRAIEPFVSYVGGVKRFYDRGELVPDNVAVKVLALTREDKPATETRPVDDKPKPRRKRAARKS